MKKIIEVTIEVRDDDINCCGMNCYFNCLGCCAFPNSKVEWSKNSYKLRCKECLEAEKDIKGFNINL